jgi:hypothetical protein
MIAQNKPAAWFLVALGIASVKRFFFHPSGNAFADSYLLDLLCIPLVLESCRWILEKLLKRRYRFTVYHCVVTVIYFSLVFEWVLPKLNNRYHSDFFDVICYGLSTTLWYIFQHKLENKRIDTIKNA